MGLIKVSREFVESGHLRGSLLNLGVKLDEIKLIRFTNGVFTYRVESEVESIPKGDIYFEIMVTFTGKRYTGLSNRINKETKISIKING